MVNYKSIGRRIAYNRKKRGITQAYLAEQLDVSESFISQIERGKAKVSLPRLYEISNIIGIDIALLVSDCTNITANNIKSEVEQIISHWSIEQREILIELILCADKKIKSN